jgi:hypothetical protein
MIKRFEKRLRPIDKQAINYSINAIKKWAEKRSKEEVLQGYIECIEWYLAKETILVSSFAKLKADLEERLEELENLLYNFPIEEDKEEAEAEEAEEK